MDEKRMDRLEEQLGGVREELRMIWVVQEGLRSDIQTVAEGVASVSEGLQEARIEMRKSHQELLDLIRPAYEVLGPKNRELDNRVSALEEREQESREVMERLRKRLSAR